jgi:hypothetical protein
MLRARPHFLLYLSLPPSFSLSLTSEEDAHTLFTGQRERDKERERERGREGERERGRGRKNCPELLFLFLKGMTGALAPFSYLVFQIMGEFFNIIWGCLLGYSDPDLPLISYLSFCDAFLPKLLSYIGLGLKAAMVWKVSFFIRQCRILMRREFW